ncbi:hypothetical protein [Rhizobium sp.]|uniref:hypothetical protein n=1 Tax=Rhizobium sp. TaxID=391 RepID=UPI00389AFC6F
MERPILLKAHEVRGILDGRQTQLRRIVKGNRQQVHYCGINLRNLKPTWVDECARPVPCPFGQVGDRLWGKETCYPTYPDKPAIRSAYYRATEIHGAGFGGRRWLTALCMPRWASRILLEIVSVRVERLQDISETDAWAQGAEGWMDEFSNVVSGEMRN